MKSFKTFLEDINEGLALATKAATKAIQLALPHVKDAVKVMSKGADEISDIAKSNVTKLRAAEKPLEKPLEKPFRRRTPSRETPPSRRRPTRTPDKTEPAPSKPTEPTPTPSEPTKPTPTPSEPTKPTPKPDVKPSEKPATKPDVKPATKPDVKPSEKPKFKTEPTNQPQTSPEPKQEPVPVNRTNTRRPPPPTRTRPIRPFGFLFPYLRKPPARIGPQYSARRHLLKQPSAADTAPAKQISTPKNNSVLSIIKNAVPGKRGKDRSTIKGGAITAKSGAPSKK